MNQLLQKISKIDVFIMITMPACLAVLFCMGVDTLFFIFVTPMVTTLQFLSKDSTFQPT